MTNRIIFIIIASLHLVSCIQKTPENPEYISKSDQFKMMESFKTLEFRKLINLELSYAFKIRDYIRNANTFSEQTINLIKQELNDE